MTKDIIKIAKELDEYYEPIEKEVKDSVYYFIAEPKKDQASSIKNDLEKELYLLEILIRVCVMAILEDPEKVWTITNDNLETEWKFILDELEKKGWDKPALIKRLKLDEQGVKLGSSVLETTLSQGGLVPFFRKDEGWSGVDGLLKLPSHTGEVARV